MKWTRDFVWSKVAGVAPHVVPAGLSLPEALKDAAINCFLREDNLSYASLVVRVSLSELKEAGILTFGSVNEDWM